MGKYFIKDGYKENLNNLYYNDTPDDGVVWQPDVYRYAVDYARKHNIKNIVDIGSGNGDKLFNHKDEFNITFIDFGPNLDIIRNRFNDSKGNHTYIDQDFEKSFPSLPDKTIKNSVVICSDVIEHIRDMSSLCEAFVAYSKKAHLLLISTPDRFRLYGFDQNGTPSNPCHVREWRINELGSYFANAGMDFLIGLTRTNNVSNQRATLCVVSGVDFMHKNDKTIDQKMPLVFLRKFVTRTELESLLKFKGLRAPKFEDNFVGLLNPYAGNYMLNHFLRAISTGKTYTVNKFKFINQDTYHNSIDAVENIDRMLIQYLNVDAGEYPVAFTFLYDGNTLSEDHQGSLMTLAVEQLYVQYLPETLIGFNLLNSISDTLSRLPNYANLQKELEAYLGIKRSAKLLAGNIKRKVARVKK